MADHVNKSIIQMLMRSLPVLNRL